MAAKRHLVCQNTTSLQHLTSPSQKTIGQIPKSHLGGLTKTAFPHLERVCHNICCQDDHMALIIIDIIKEQDNDVIENLCADNNCTVIIVPHDVTNKCQLLDITVNKPAKCFISEM